GSVRYLSGGLDRRARLCVRCGLLRADDSGADVRKTPGISRPSSQLCKFPGGNNSAHNCAARLSDPRIDTGANPFYWAWDRFSRRDRFTVACAVWWLVSLVVVAANEVSLSLGDADRLRDQPGSCARNGTWTARSSIPRHFSRDSCDLCRMDFVIRCLEAMSRA